MDKNHNKDIENKLKEIVDDYQRQEDSQNKSRQIKQKKKMKKEKISLCVWRVGVFFSIAAAGYIFILILSQQQVIARKPLWVIGVQRPSDYKIKGCTANLWVLRDAIDRFYAENKRFPDLLEEVCEGGFLAKKVKCPLGGEYNIITKAGRRVIVCSDSDKHGVSRVWLDLKTGPPRIQRW